MAVAAMKPGSSLPGLLLLLLLTNAVCGRILETRLHISEGPANYHQDVWYDSVERSMKMHVPHHNQIDETTTIINEPKGTKLRYIHRLLRCDLLTLDKEFNIEEAFMNMVGAEGKNVTATPQQATTVRHLLVFGGTVSDAERATLLSPSQVELCQGMPIERKTRIMVNEDELNSGFFSPELAMETQENDNTTSNILPGLASRVKRDNWDSSNRIQCPLDNVCARGRIGYICEWFICPKMTATMDCIKHMRENDVRCVSCCTTRSYDVLCKCNTINSDSTFVACQKKLMKFYG